ncbi:MAG: hypothetical protein WCK58_00815 [Chloroflexota bacterium]
MTRLVRVIRLGTMIGLGAMGLGALVLFAYAFSEVLADPSLSLEDGYWIGRLPWTALGVGLVVGGASLALVTGAIVAFVAGGLVRRAVALGAVIVGAWWWLLVVITAGMGGGCPDCVRSGPDPIATAYSLPVAALVFLVLPAVCAAVAGLAAGRRERARLIEQAAG